MILGYGSMLSYFYHFQSKLSHLTPGDFEHRLNLVKNIDINTLEADYQHGHHSLDAEAIECLGLNLKRLTKQDKNLNQLVNDMIGMLSPSSFWEIDFKWIYDSILSHAGNKILHWMIEICDI